MKRIFIISNYPLFGRGLQNLLNQQNNIEVVGQETCIERVNDQIKMLHPDIVIFDSDEPMQASTPGLLYRIMKEHSGIKIVGLSLQDNKFRVYGAVHGVVHEVADFLKIIFQEPSSSALD
jgi:DNA-binding NarL/FixJ family response regulator